jgi:hypothetical protein
MNRFTTLLLIVVFSCPIISYSQAAGNFFYNQKAKVSPSSEASYYSGGNYQTQTQTYTNNAGYYADSWKTPQSDSVMHLNVSVMMNQRPDAWVMILGLTQVGENMEDAHQKINARIAALENTLGGDFSEDDFYIDFISQSPIFGMEVEKKLFSKNYVEVPIGFEVKKNVHVLFKSLEKADEIIMKAAENEIYDIIKVQPIVEDKSVVYDSLRKECIALLNKKKENLEALGMTLSPLFNALDERIYCTYPINQYRSYQSYLDHTRQRLRGDERLVSTASSVNLFYNKRSDASFDKVINPLMHGPVLQFTMDMRLSYTMKRIED